MTFGGAGGSGASGASLRPRRGRLSCPSVTQRLPSLSTYIPCGKIIVPLPKLFTSLPEPSNFRIGSSVELRQVFAPQGSPTQIDVPPLSTPPPRADPPT